MSLKSMLNDLNCFQHVRCAGTWVLRRGSVQFSDPQAACEVLGKTEADFSCRSNNFGDSWQEQKQNRSKRAEGR